jgi:hypothetical protein
MSKGISCTVYEPYMLEKRKKLMQVLTTKIGQTSPARRSALIGQTFLVNILKRQI